MKPATLPLMESHFIFHAYSFHNTEQVSYTITKIRYPK